MVKLLFSIILFLPIISAIVVYVIDKKSDKIRNLFTCLITFITFFVSIILVFLFDHPSFVIPSVSSFGLSFNISGFNSILLLLTTFLWFISSIFSNEYFAHYKNKGRCSLKKSRALPFILKAARKEGSWLSSRSSS